MIPGVRPSYGNALGAINFPMAGFELRRNGPKDGSEDLRNFRDACLSAA